MSVGENFRFGNRAKGDAALLQAQDAFATRVVELVEIDGEIVSSTHIRGLIATGAVADAARLLGAPFGMRGIVAHGDKRGRTLGFPTANLVPDPALAVPDHGIYACRAAVPGVGEWTAAVSIGVRPTFVTGRGLLVEAFLLDFEGDLYGQRAAAATSSSASAARSASTPSTRWSSRCTATWRTSSRWSDQWTIVRASNDRQRVPGGHMRVLLAHALTPKRRRIARVLRAAGHEV